MAQQVVAVQVASRRAHRGHAAIVTRSVVWRRASRDPIQAAAPTTGVMKSMIVPLCMLLARRFHNGGIAMVLR